ncbi:YciI family protein [Devosia sp.]|uniref:YciI family protein n=1 Tax=Devosia sp. TaxID=1871048 RepID=UPI003266837F
MRFMILVKATPDTEAGVPPRSEVIAAMGTFNEQLIEAGILLAADGLHPSKNGARIQNKAGQIIVTDGPFAETKELISGFWMIQVPSYADALEWAKRVPMYNGQEIELRKAFEATDFAVDTVTEEHLEKEQAWRDANQKPITKD